MSKNNGVRILQCSVDGCIKQPTARIIRGGGLLFCSTHAPYGPETILMLKCQAPGCFTSASRFFPVMSLSENNNSETCLNSDFSAQLQKHKNFSEILKDIDEGHLCCVCGKHSEGEGGYLPRIEPTQDLIESVTKLVGAKGIRYESVTDVSLANINASEGIIRCPLAASFVPAQSNDLIPTLCNEHVKISPEHKEEQLFKCCSRNCPYQAIYGYRRTVAYRYPDRIHSNRSLDNEVTSGSRKSSVTFFDSDCLNQSASMSYPTNQSEPAGSTTDQSKPININTDQSEAVNCPKNQPETIDDSDQSTPLDCQPDAIDSTMHQSDVVDSTIDQSEATDCSKIQPETIDSPMDLSNDSSHIPAYIKTTGLIKDAHSRPCFHAFRPVFKRGMCTECYSSRAILDPDESKWPRIPVFSPLPPSKPRAPHGIRVDAPSVGFSGGVKWGKGRSWGVFRGEGVPESCSRHRKWGMVVLAKGYPCQYFIRCLNTSSEEVTGLMTGCDLSLTCTKTTSKDSHVERANKIHSENIEVLSLAEDESNEHLSKNGISNSTNQEVPTLKNEEIQPIESVPKKRGRPRKNSSNPSVKNEPIPSDNNVSFANKETPENSVFQHFLLASLDAENLAENLLGHSNSIPANENSSNYKCTTDETGSYISESKRNRRILSSQSKRVNGMDQFLKGSWPCFHINVPLVGGGMCKGCYDNRKNDKNRPPRYDSPREPIDIEKFLGNCGLKPEHGHYLNEVKNVIKQRISSFPPRKRGRPRKVFPESEVYSRIESQQENSDDCDILEQENESEGQHGFKSGDTTDTDDDDDSAIEEFEVNEDVKKVLIGALRCT